MTYIPPYQKSNAKSILQILQRELQYKKNKSLNEAYQQKTRSIANQSQVPTIKNAFKDN